MNGNIAFWDFPPGERELILEQNRFYLEQAKSRFLRQFSNIKEESELHRDEELKRMSSHFNPDYHDESSFYEAADDAGIIMYESLSELRNSMVLSIASGMLHNFEKRMRQKLTEELNHTMDTSEVKRMVWWKNSNFDQLIELLSEIKPGIGNQDFIEDLQLLRLIVNVYKHGDGGSHKKLSKQYPEFYSTNEWATKFGFELEYGELTLPDEYLDKFAAAIDALWRFLPERVSLGEYKNRNMNN